MEHGQQDAEPIGTILSGIATLLRELGDQLDIAAARVDDTTSLDARLKKLESWAAGAGQDITVLQTRMDKVDPAGTRPATAARLTRAERREAAERAELEAAASRNDETATASAPAANTLDSGASASNDLLALSSAPDDETGSTAGASTEAGRRESVPEAPAAPPRLAPLSRLPAPDLVAEPAGITAAPEDSQREDVSVPDRGNALGDRAAATAPNRRLPRANFPRRQPARAESGADSGSSLLGNAGPPAGTDPLAGTDPRGNAGRLDNGGLPENSGLLAQSSDVDRSVQAENNGAAGNAGLGSGESHRRRIDNGTGNSVGADDAAQADDAEPGGAFGRLGEPAGTGRGDGKQQSGAEVGRRSAHSRAVTEAPTGGATGSGLPGSPVESDAGSTGATHSADVSSSDSAERPAAPSGLPERLPGTTSGGSRLPRRAAAYTPPAESGAATGESATPSRAERRRLAEADAAQSDSAHVAPARVPAPSTETDRPVAAHSRPTLGDAETRSAHAKPAGEHAASRHAEAFDRPAPARPETASTADPAGPAARALGIGSMTSERADTERSEAAGELAAKRLAARDAPATDVIPGLSALLRLGDESDSSEESPSSAAPQRGSRRSDRREAAELERSGADAEPSARAQSHHGVIDGEHISTSLPAQDSSGSLPARGPSVSLPQRDNGNGLPQRDAGSLPTRDTSGSLPTHEISGNLPRRDSATELPQHDSGAGFTPGDMGNGLPERDSGSHLPQHDSNSGLPHRDSGAEQGLRDSNVGLPQRDISTRFPQSDTGTGLPQPQTAAASPQPDAADALVQRDIASALPARDTVGGLPQRDSGSSLPQRGARRALPQRETIGGSLQAEANDALAHRGTHSTRAEIGTEDANTPPGASGSLPTRDVGAAGTLPRRDPGHAAPPRDAVAEIASDLSAPRSAGRHNSRDDQIGDLLAESEPRVDRLRRSDSSAHGEPGAQHSEQRDSRFEGIRPAESPARDSWQGDLDRLAAETAYVDSDPGSADRPAVPDVESSAAPAVPPALHDWIDQPVPSAEPVALPRRVDGPSGVTRRVEPAGITPRPAPAQLNPFGPPTSALTAGIDEPASVEMPFDLDLTAPKPEVSSPDVAEPAPTGKPLPTIEDNAHVDKLQAMLDELKRNPAGPFGRALNTPPENSGH